MAGCQEFGKQLSAYADGELEASSQAEVHQHVQGCASCRQALRELQALSSVTRAEPPAVSGEEWQRRWRLIREAVPEIQPRLMSWQDISAWFANRRRQWVPLASAAALFLALVLGFSLLEQRPARSPGISSYAVDSEPVLAVSSAASPPELLEGSFSSNYMPLFLTSGDKDVAIVWLVEKEGASPESSAL